MADFIWAIDENGKPTKCKAKPENRGKRNCKHLFHGNVGEELNDFIERYSLNENEIKKSFKEKEEDIEYGASQSEIESWASQLDEIAGEKVTMDNFDEVISRMSPEQLDQINRIGFDAAPAFSLPITDEKFDEEKINNDIYFADLPDYGIGKASAMNDMFGSIGMVPTSSGNTEINSNYRDGLSDDEYFEKQFSTRGSQVQKTITVAAPGHVAREVFYGMSSLEAIDDCGNSSSNGIIECHAPGVCVKCAKKSGFKVKPGQLIGSIVSTNLTEGLTQASLNSIHTGGRNEKKDDWETITDTLHCYKSSPIIDSAVKAEDTMTARKNIVNGLKEHYKNAGIDIDDYNLEIVAKKVTSYKIDNGRLRAVKDGEKCDIVSMERIGNNNNLFLQSELSNSYNIITKPQLIDNDQRNAAVQIMG